eukprot:1892354-Prymnesium_polylepis.1
MKAFSTALASSGAMAKLEKLLLFNNQIGDQGMQAFSTALASGAMANLETLYMHRNPGDPAAVKEACKARGISCT